MAGGADDAVEVEAMLKEDGSWHPCQLSLSSGTTGYGLIVAFGSSNLEDIISNKDDALARLRMRSLPLQDDDCVHVREGEHILAMSKIGSLFFDAEVEKAKRIKHSSKARCRCTFEIKWLHSELKGEIVTVSSSSIRKLSMSKIDTHPTVAAFLSFVSPNCMELPSYTSLLEDANCETDTRLLEKQIEEIGRLADISEKGYSEEILLGLREVDPTRCKQREKIVSMHGQAPFGPSDFKRSTRSQRKLQVEMEFKDPPPTRVTLEENLKNRPRLGPLAARAALASLMHELPDNPEISYHVEKESYVDMSQNTPKKHINVISSDVIHSYMKSDVYIQEKESMMGELSVTSSILFPVVSNPIQTVKSVTLTSEDVIHKSKSPVSRRGASKRSRLAEKSPGIPEEEKPTIVTKFCKDRSSNICTTRTTRSTHSAITAEMGNSNNEVKPALSTEERKFDTSASRKRSTRSTVRKEMGDSITKCEQNLENNLLAGKTQVEITVDLGSPYSRETKKKPLSSPVDDERDVSQRRKKTQRESNATTTIKKDQGEIFCNGKAEKQMAASKKPELRFSARLKFLPRTRSQKKC